MRLSAQPATHSLSPINQPEPAASSHHSSISRRRQQPNQQTKPQRGPRAVQPSVQSEKSDAVHYAWLHHLDPANKRGATQTGAAAV
jgi:hypothetical protein